MNSARSRPQPRPSDPLRWLLPATAAAVGIIWAAVLFLLPRSAPDMAVRVPAKNRPAYHVIQATDLMTATIKVGESPAKVLSTDPELVNHYTLVPLQASMPVTAGQVYSLSDPIWISNTVAVGLPASTDMGFGGNLTKGDLVDLMFVPMTSSLSLSATTSIYTNTLILDVRPTPGDQQAHSFTMVVAVPAGQLDRLLAYATTHRLFVVRRPLR